MWDPGVQSGSREPSEWVRVSDTTPSAMSSLAETVTVAAFPGAGRPGPRPLPASATALVPTMLSPPVVGLHAGCAATTDGRDGILNQ
jgi:hypothetical protein